MTKNRTPNRLITEKSPYLLQHAYNPVDWYPWGEEAFTKAKRDNKPVFVSIGYSTCHWCHVMERESFEDEEVARLLNERFVSIKVDREERPDIDSIYMLVCQMMNGHGGWPLNIFMTPDKVPFYAGTYFPKESRAGMPGLKEVIVSLYDLYMKNPEKITETTNDVKDALNKFVEKDEKVSVSLEVVHRAFQHYEQSFDAVFGGFGSAPKFPMPHVSSFLLMYYQYFNNEQALSMAVKTLDGMRRGGIYDHIGYGFSRYSVDRQFLVPHFEKMLYDNALLAMVYTEAFQVTGNRIFRQTAEEILTYCIRDLEHPNGGFYSAEDADSEGVEGKFYLWTKDEVINIAGEELGSLFCHVYDITTEGNFEGKNIPNLINEDIETYASRRGLDIGDLIQKLETVREMLFQEREKRIRPFKDDKILLAWNGLIIAALSRAGKVFGNYSYIESAERTVRFIEKYLFQNGRAMVRFRAGETKEKGFLDEYAFYLWGLLELFQATLKNQYLRKAKKIADNMIELFWDEKAGGFFFTGSDQEEILVRQKESYDGALPSGNSVAAMQLLKLGKLTGDFTYEEKVEKIFQTFGRDLHTYPNGHAMMLQALIMSRHPSKEVVVLLGDEDKEVEKLLNSLRTNFNPNLTLLVGNGRDLAEVAPFTIDFKTINGKTTYYVCENFQCHQPVTDVNQALELISNNAKKEE